MTYAHLRGIPPHRHLEKFSQIFQAQRLLATHCLSTVCEFASRAIYKRRRKSKKIDMPVQRYPYRASQVRKKLRKFEIGGHVPVPLSYLNQ